VRRARELAFCASVAAAVVLGYLAAQGGLEPFVLQASAATVGAQRLSGSAAKLPSPPKGKPEFSASFYGLHLNTKVWDTCYPADSQSGCTNFGNKEYEWYVPGRVRLSKGVLSLSTRRVATKGKAADGKPKEYGCRSGMITSYPGFRFTYGFVQVVAKVPHKAGLWPALWLAAADLKFPPEIDMIEAWSGAKTETAAFLHPVGAPQDRGLIPESLTTNWQTYSLSWTKSRLTFYVGSKKVLTVTKRIPHQAMYFVANVAEYTKPEKGDCYGGMQIRSVKVWK
jgi:beta-glucanase (GH16 family)